MRRQKGAPLLPALVLAAVLSGCGGDTGGAAPGDESGATSPREFAETVCGTLDIWASSVEGKAAAISTHLHGTAAQTRDFVLDVLRGLSFTTDELLETVEEAGVPDVEGAEELTEDLTGAVRRARDALAGIRREVHALKLGDPGGIVAAAQDAQAGMQQALQDVMDEIESAPSEEIEAAFEDVEPCALLRS